MLSPGDRVLVCVSGGPDSVCLLDILWRMSPQLNVKLSVCHVDHMLRGKLSGDDALFVEKLARGKELPFYSARKNVKLYSERKKLSIEQAAREIRYNFFYETARKHNLNLIATAHNLDDQAETVLINLIRGAGLEGLSGIPPKRAALARGVKIIRPLIETRRLEIEDYLNKHKLSSRQDISNSDTVYFRNKIRIELIPFIENNFEPEIKSRLASTAKILRQHGDFFSKTAGDMIKEKIIFRDKASFISTKDLNKLPAPAGRLLLQEAFNKAENGFTCLAYSQIEQLLRLAGPGRPNRYINLPGSMVAVREYGQIIFQDACRVKKPLNADAGMKVPGDNFLPGGIKINFRIIDAERFERSGKTAAIDLDSVKLPLRIRGRKSGDRFSPLGMRGTKKLKDFLIDKKIPSSSRACLLILVDAAGAIAAVITGAGEILAIEDKMRITPQTSRVLQVKIV